MKKVIRRCVFQLRRKILIMKLNRNYKRMNEILSKVSNVVDINDIDF